MKELADKLTKLKGDLRVLAFKKTQVEEELGSILEEMKKEGFASASEIESFLIENGAKAEKELQELLPKVQDLMK